MGAGHEATAFTRSAGGVTQRHRRLHIVEGDVFDTHSVERAVVGQDTVLIALGEAARVWSARHPGGHRGDEPDRVNRLICQSTLGAGERRADLNFVRASALDWTIVRPSAFTNGPRTGSAGSRPVSTVSR